MLHLTFLPIVEFFFLKIGCGLKVPNDDHTHRCRDYYWLFQESFRENLYSFQKLPDYGTKKTEMLLKENLELQETVNRINIEYQAMKNKHDNLKQDFTTYRNEYPAELPNQLGNAFVQPEELESCLRTYHDLFGRYSRFITPDQILSANKYEWNTSAMYAILEYLISRRDFKHYVNFSQLPIYVADLEYSQIISKQKSRVITNLICSLTALKCLSKF